MIPIFICDDNPGYLEMLKNMIEECINEEKLDFTVEISTTTPKEIISCLEDKTPCREVFFLDYDLKDYDYDGIRLGIAVRRARPDCFIVYVTSFTEAAFLTYHYQINSVDYILKDDPEGVGQKIRRVLLKIQEEVGQNPDSDLAFIFNGQLVDVNKLVYIETTKGLHRLNFYNEYDRFNVGGSILEIKKLLSEYFFQCSRGILVNLKNIKYIGLTE